MSKTIRYAVVGLGYFAQGAVLPAFRHSGKNSQLAALVSSDPVKLKILGRTYGVSALYSYEQYEDCLISGGIDAVYIALPNHLHRDYAIAAAEAGIHILCEKPLALSEADSRAIIDSARIHGVHLMVAYRLHLDPATLEVIKQVKAGKIGRPKFFSSVFSHQVRSGNIRTRDDVGGGGLWDLGVYCVNAARNIFRQEPESVFAITSNSDPKRFKGVDEMATAILRFPGNRHAQFTTSQAAADTSHYRIVGTRGEIVADPGYEYAEGLALQITIGGKKKKIRYPKRDQIAPEIVYFSDCILKNRQPEPSGVEGLADVRILEALYRSAERGHPIKLDSFNRTQRAEPDQKITRPPVTQPELVHATPASKS